MDDIKNFSEFNIVADLPLVGQRESVNNVCDKLIVILDYSFIKVRDNYTNSEVDSTQVQFRYDCETIPRIFFTRSKVFRRLLEKVGKGNLPFRGTVRRKDKCLVLE